MANRGYSATKDQLLARLARIEGQVRGVARMVEDERYCIDVLTQLSAIQAALDHVALGLLDDHARHCLLAGGAGRRAHGGGRAAAEALTARGRGEEDVEAVGARREALREGGQASSTSRRNRCASADRRP